MSDGLLDALREIGWSDLPHAIGDGYKKKWIKAIVKVLRSNGRTGYCLAVNDGSDNPRLVRDFSPTAIISRIISIHPYEESEVRNILPKFRNDEDVLKYLVKSPYKRSDVLALLSTEGKTKEQIKADREQINGYINEIAMREAKAKAEADEQAEQFRKLADPDLKEKNIKAKKYGRATATRKTKRSKSED